ncbi:immunodominant staphylococcal antigen IsaB family protein [Macrococcus brunensis]|uniref:immunodominant staphylococcal antigen IsaB family protein n=1 Tax=Macrococcus brunensis TaxID=198483 RepID=UPI001EF13E28|nr:hypothetical protein [Macrococcus brunensis]ULG72237.1 hypothetical protein MGG12_01545 [Macrococcus brunensis]
MNKLFPYALSATILLSGLSIASSAPAEAVTTSSQSVNQTIPYYTYNGYFRNNSKTLINKQFVLALKNDNVKINGYMINKKRPKTEVKTQIKYRYDIMMDVYKNKVVGIHLLADEKAITLKQFKAAHKGTKILKVKDYHNGAYHIIYQTKNGGSYEATFDNGYLTLVTIH